MKNALLVMVTVRRAPNRIAICSPLSTKSARAPFSIWSTWVSWNATNPRFPTPSIRSSTKAQRMSLPVPYFLHTGNHVADDLPTLLEEAQEKYPHVSFAMGDYIGRDPLVIDVLAQRVNEA
jgi:hypothetical protein